MAAFGAGVTQCDRRVERAKKNDPPKQPEVDAYFRCKRGSGDTYVIEWWCPVCRARGMTQTVEPKDFERHGLLRRRRPKRDDTRELDFICGCSRHHLLPGGHAPVVDQAGCLNGFTLNVKYPPCDEPSEQLRYVP